MTDISKATVPPLPNEHACDYMARCLALAGLGTINGTDRLTPPNRDWSAAEWKARVLECIPGRAEERCRALALTFYRDVFGGTDR